MTTTTRSAGSGARSTAVDPRPILVGIDETAESLAALDWAVAEARSRSVALRLVHTWDWAQERRFLNRVDEAVMTDFKRAGQASLEKAKARAEAAGVVGVDADVRRGYGPDVFADLGADAAMIVLGTRHLPAVGRAVLGSVSTASVCRAPCPVVVLSAPPGADEELPSVVVGVAGVPHDEQLLAFGFDFAHRRNLRLRAVHCWDPLFGDRTMPPPEQARLELAEAVAGWREHYPEVEARYVARRGHPVDALVDESASQALLVVGRHAQRMRFGALLGSASLGVLHHATCPVAVIPPSRV